MTTAKTELDKLIDQSAIHYNSNNIEGAIVCCAKALKMAPDCVDALSNMGTLMWAKGKTEEAEIYFNKAIKINPTHIASMLNVATLSHDKGDLETALEWYEAASKLKPLNAEILWRKGIVKLAMGDYVTGWALYEEGLGYETIRGKTPGFKVGQWRGDYCNRLAIWHEQGFGDTLQFVRYAEIAKQFANKVYVLCPKELHAIIKTCPFVDAVVDCLEDGDFDQQCSIMSLPYILKATVQNIPTKIPYLIPPKDLVEKWKEKTKSDLFKVGLVWAGNPRKNAVRFAVVDGKRSISLDMLKPLLDVPNVQFYSLQKGEGEGLVAGNMINLMGDVHDFADTAAIIQNLDLVISVDTSVVHLTGAMGKPVWVLSRFDACWRWLRNQENSPYYPTARVFGQPEPGNWTACIEKVASELGRLFS